MNLLFRLVMVVRRCLFHLRSKARKSQARLVARRGPIQYVPADFRNVVDAEIINVPAARWAAGPLRSQNNELPPFLRRQREEVDDATW